MIVAHLFGAESDLVSQGLLGFSPVLTAIALGVTFHRPSPRIAAYAALGVVFTVIAQAALNVALRPFAIPALTAPFVLVSWMFLLPPRVSARRRRNSGLRRLRLRGGLRVEVVAIAEARADRDDHRHEQGRDDARREAVVVEVQPGMQRADRHRGGRMHEARDHAPAEAEPARNRREGGPEQGRERDGQVGGMRGARQRTEENAENDRRDVAGMLQ